MRDKEALEAICLKKEADEVKNNKKKGKLILGILF
jgi:hypothetical protein